MVRTARRHLRRGRLPGNRRSADYSPDRPLRQHAHTAVLHRRPHLQRRWRIGRRAGYFSAQLAQPENQPESGAAPGQQHHAPHRTG
ncbi:hypothetical protein G6F22_020897 [Rhizopus arrhizus]|nr:hypothetical protein G6F22_020897 [Rhizopus arrhizus]KAG1238097.1 hypothetical protein G6F68_018778 [Rhizopus microsporus]